MRRVALTIAAIALASAAGGVARADSTAGVDSHLFRPTLDPNGVFSVEGAEAMPRYDFAFHMGFGFGQTPFTTPVPGVGDDSEDPLLKFAIGVHLGFAFAVTDALTIAMDTGLYRTDTDEGYGSRGLYYESGPEPSTGLLSLRPLSNLDPSGNFQDEQLVGPFDTRLGAKYAILDGKKLALSVVADVTLPFGDEEMLLGDQSFVFTPKLALDYALGEGGASKVLVNLGARLRERTILEAYDSTDVAQTPDDAQVMFDLGPEAIAAAGLLYEVLPQLIAGAEGTVLVPLPASLAYGSCRRYNGDRCSSIDDEDYFAGADYGDLAAYVLAGIDYRATPDVTLTVAGGAGLVGARSESFRILGGVTWTPTPEGARVIGRGDGDGDGNPDSTDICADEPEDRDGYQDDDGCPDLDNDGDGIIDASDGCTEDPEDKDGHQDDDGCPERDNDGDDIEDVVDRYPNDKEDRDNFEDDDGCPDEDNDGDGIADAKDRCPNERETVNGFDDTDGCPDQALAGGPQWDPDNIDLRGAKIEFASKQSAKLTKASTDLLEQVAKLIQAKPDAVVRVEVHVALSTKSDNKRTVARAQAADMQLARQRAQAVVDYLTKQGVRVQQLSFDALGSKFPIQQPAWDPINDRVDFIKVQ
jgi:outer membrane protein OmpA-like peptidoglycan-associated protein